MEKMKWIKKGISALLALNMVLSSVPLPVFAVTEDNLCEHHPVHTAECHYAESVAGSDCTHVHDELCGYVAAVEAHECHYECAACAAAPASEEPSEESSEPAPVCYCVEKCTAESFNEYCDVCGVDYSKCTGTDTAAVYADECAHSFAGGVCDTCGEVAVAKIGETYYATLAEAAAEVTEGGTIEVLTDVTIGEDETLTFAAFATLDVAEGKTVTCSGTVKIGEEDGIIFENTLYYYGGDVTNTRVHTVRVPTYFKAGAGHIITTYDEASNTIMMVMDNATVTTSNGASPVSSNYNLHIQFSGSNTVADTAFNDGISTNSPVSCGIYLDTSEDKMDLTLSGAEGAVLNITAADATGYSYGICAKSVTVTGGTVNITSGNSGSYSYGIFADSVVIHEGATLDLTVGKAENMAIGAGVASNEGTVNGLIMMPDENAALGVVYVASGKTVLIADFTAFDADLPFTVPAGSNLTVNSGVTVDLSVLTADDIDFSGTVINNGTIILPEGFGIENAPKGGTVTIGEDSYTWNGQKWICDENNHIGGTATCVAQAVCDICGSSYGELAAHTPDAGGKCTVDGCGYQYAAKVGDTFYETIHKALRAAEGNSGCTLTLLDDITLTSMSSTASYTNQGTFILDLNGKTLSSNKGTLNVLGSADLTIRDSAGGGKIISTYSNAIYQTGGKVTIESGSFEGTLDGVFLSGSSTLIVKGGTFVGSRAMITGFGSDCVIDLTAIDPTGYTLKNNGSGTFAPKLPEGYGMVDGDGKLLASLSAEQSATVHKHEYKYTDLGDGKHQQTCSCGLTNGEPAAHSTTADGDKAANCGSKAYCSVCESYYGDVDLTNHDENAEYGNGFCLACDAYQPAELVGTYYQITNAGQLYWFAAQVNAGSTAINAELKADIKVNDNVLTANGTLNGDGSAFRAWTPIGTKDNAYTGTFNGNDKTISGLYFKDTGAYYVGLFGYVGSGTVNHVGVIDSYFYGSRYVGGVVGYNNGTVECAYNTGTVSGTKYAGGVVGYNYYGTVQYVYNTGEVAGMYYVGGVTSENYGTMEYAYNTGTVSAADYYGGIVGDYNSLAPATNCYYLSDTETDKDDGTTAKTAEQFASGEVAYLLGSPFGQNIGTHVSPVVYLGYEVYQVHNCKNEVAYSNTNENIGHSYENGICTVCGAACAHSGGEATCTTLAVCTVCGESYGQVNADAHSYGDWVSNGDDTHTRTCANDSSHTENGDCSGGKATCKEQAVCGTCGISYGEVDLTKHNETVAYENGFCPNGCYEPAEDSDSDGYYEIGNAGQLYWFAAQVNGGNTAINAILTKDITVNENVLNEDGTLNGDGSNFRVWTPIGNYDYPYTGTFNGNGKTVSGLYFNDSSTSNVGLFGYVSSGTMNHVGVINSYFNGYNHVGGVAGLNGGTVKNCYNTSTVSGSIAGGLVGISFGTVENCYNTGTVSGNEKVDGIVGSPLGKVVNCFNLDTCGMTDVGTYKTAEQFASGEVAYLLQGEQTEQIWGQTIGTEDYPVLGGAKVYPVYNCSGELSGYTNTQTSGQPQHTHGTPSYSWSEDPTTLTVSVSCTACGETFTGSTTDMDVTTSADGSTTTYTAAVTLDGRDYTDSRVVDNEVSSVSITWGSMDFTYTDESGWNNPDTAWVQVENTGSTAATVGYDYVTDRTDITGSFFDGTATVTAPVAIDTESTKKIWLRLDGRPSEALNNTTIGSVKLTIE